MKVKLRFSKEQVVCPYIEKGKSLCSHPSCIRMCKYSCWIYRKKVRFHIVRDRMKGSAKVKYHGN